MSDAFNPLPPLVQGERTDRERALIERAKTEHSTDELCRALAGACIDRGALISNGSTVETLVGTLESLAAEGQDGGMS